MAADLIESAEVKFPGSDSVKRAKQFAYLKLMEKNQNMDLIGVHNGAGILWDIDVPSGMHFHIRVIRSRVS